MKGSSNARFFSDRDGGADRSPVPPMPRFLSTAQLATDLAVSAVSEDEDVAYDRASLTDGHGNRIPVLIVRPIGGASNAVAFERLQNEYRMRDKLDGGWAMLPLELQRQGDHIALVLEDAGGVPLEHLLTARLPTERFLTLAIAIAAAVHRMHVRDIVHRDLKPAHLYVDDTAGLVRITGFGIASDAPSDRERTSPPDIIAGTMAYMAPEQTGRLNCPIDCRTDLYGVGVVFYRMLTGTMPFAAASTTEWIHSHTARKPVPPHLRDERIDAQLSAIVMKLLEKEPGARYQGAAALERDLRRCAAQWFADATINSFDLGGADLPSRLSGPVRLYGREQELARLMGAFERIVHGGRTEFALVSGYAGVGKSSLVRALQAAVGPAQGMFAVGKCDQHNRDTPYGAIALALKSLVKPLFTLRDDLLRRWRDALADALGPNGKLITDFAPDLALLLGEQPPVAELPLQQAHARFQLVLYRFIQVFTRLKPPLVLIVDDLQWADAATLDLLEGIGSRSGLRHMLLIGAYRDNEVNVAHPLPQQLARISSSGVAVDEIRLPPLTVQQTTALVGDILRSDDNDVESLARIVHAKTAGNPFFVVQFLHALADENVLLMDRSAGQWSWNTQAIRSARYTDNVAELMSARLQRLPDACKDALRALACLGNRATVRSLAIALHATEDTLQAELRIARQQQLIERVGNTYRFAHDRIQEAAYSLIPEAARAEMHRDISRRLLLHLPDTQDDALLFEIVAQFERAGSDALSADERRAAATLDLRAGIRSKASAAYGAAMRYLHAGVELLACVPDTRWPGIRFEFELELAECEFLTGELAAAERRLSALCVDRLDVIDGGRVAVRRMDVYTALDRSGEAIAVALAFLRRVGIDTSAHPSDLEVHDEYAALRRRAAGMTIDDIVGLPSMADPIRLTTLEVLTRLLSAACFTDFNLNSLITCKAINLSLASGNCEASCVAYGTLSRIAGPRFGDFDLGIRFGEAGYRLTEFNAQHRFHASTCMVFVIFTLRWMTHVRLSEDALRRVFTAANKAGDLLYASYSLTCLNTNFLFAGDPLRTVGDEVERGLAFARNARHGLVVDILSTQIALVRTLRGQTRRPGSLDDGRLDEPAFESHLAANPGLAIAECWYWTRKMQARYLFGDYETALESLRRAHALMWTSSMFLEEAEFHFYAALTLATAIDDTALDERASLLARFVEHQARIDVLAGQFHKNFEHRAALLGAERARIESRTVDAQNLYEHAIRSARTNDFPHQEAIASELAARFYRARGFDIIADAYVRQARHGYMRWGADAKVRQLDDTHPHLRAETGNRDRRETIRSTAGEIDYAMLIDVSQRVSSEIVPEKVIDTFMKAALTHSGADRGLLILASGDGDVGIRADATVGDDGVTVVQESSPLDASRLPIATINYVLRTRETVSSHDASKEPICASDPYTIAQHVRSILCMPLVRGDELTGVLYLESRLATGVFAPSRLAALGVLASQVAISLQNARLYRELSEREARIRRLVDANIIGIFIYALDGTIVEANSALLDLIGYSRDELERGQLNWRSLTPPEWIEADLRIHEPTLRATGVLAPIEKEYFRRDGSRAPVLVGAAMFSSSGQDGVAFVLDLSESKRANARARESESRFREMQQELAHANRVSSVGQLTATISHEVKQPIAAMAANADAAQRWLAARPANVDRASKALDLIVRDALRAGDIIDRIRNFVRKSPVREEIVDVNVAILDILFVTRRDAEKNGVCIETTLATPSPLVVGDRVQLQQVFLNLIVNAIEAMQAVNEGRRTLVISTSNPGDRSVEICVADSGPGVSDANMERLFEPFFTTKDMGMGIGLSITHSVVAAHGGRLCATAREPSGTAFHVMLPSARG
ncbi:ATP-binding sensor histidine kinase [Burkholderia cepacia]|uniref:trifunctional serine/threonine-protein kinase/ATP-binding protein/sensor histidine kinase n=1 Tax=Burkholderia cepacia TaxID=292 RepID=UPI000756E989|nr:ATP-binding sensor histidine kinase [Burkholderia cepacia]KWC91608.1 histidine kinase [Burkholderia cepacia]